MPDFIGVDVGGTKLAGAVFRAGQLFREVVKPTRSDSSHALLEDLVDTIEQLRTPETAAVGIGVPSIVDFATGRVRHSNNIALADVPLRDVLTERVGVPVYVDNDANCAALAEAWDGDLLVCRDLVMVTVGTGVGGGLVLDGQLYRGATGAAAEVGHIIIGMPFPDPDDLHDADASGRWTLEQLSAGTELDRLARQSAAAWPNGLIGQRLAARGSVTGRDAVTAAAGGDGQAILLMRTLGARLGVGIANLINIFDPAEVVIGGGVSAAGELLLEPARETARRFTFPGVGTQCVIRVARAGEVAGLVGSALLAKTEHSREELSLL